MARTNGNVIKLTKKRPLETTCISVEESFSNPSVAYGNIYRNINCDSTKTLLPSERRIFIQLSLNS